MRSVDYGKYTNKDLGVTRPREIDTGLKKVTIRTGELHASSKPVFIYTLLGSCVSVCLHDHGKGIGGMNHILVPGRADLKNFNEPARYGINAMEILINKMLKLGARRDHLKAKVFGGGHVIKAIDKKFSSGEKNTEFVFTFLKTERIPILGYNVGGNCPRTVLFNTLSGSVVMKRIRSTNVLDLTEQEQDMERYAALQAGKPGNFFPFE